MVEGPLTKFDWQKQRPELQFWQECFGLFGRPYEKPDAWQDAYWATLRKLPSKRRRSKKKKQKEWKLYNYHYK